MRLRPDLNGRSLKLKALVTLFDSGLAVLQSQPGGLVAALHYNQKYYQAACDLLELPPVTSVLNPFTMGLPRALEWPQERTCIILDMQYMHSSIQCTVMMLDSRAVQQIDTMRIEKVVAPKCDDEAYGFERPSAVCTYPRCDRFRWSRVKNALRDGMTRAGPLRASVTYVFALLDNAQ